MRTNSVQRKHDLSYWLLGLLLCCGGAIVWMLLLGWIGACLTWWMNRERTYEYRHVQLRENGEPYVIISRSRNIDEAQSREYQSLDGTPIKLDPNESNWTTQSESAGQLWFAEPFSRALSYNHGNRAWGSLTYWIDAPEPLPRSMTLFRFDEEGLPWTGGRRSWYFRWPRHPGGSGYFEGFDNKTKRRIGFIGQNGFSEQFPSEANQFPAWGIKKSAVAVFITQSHHEFPPSRELMPFHEKGQTPEVGLWYVTPQRDRLYVINLTRRTIAATRELHGKLQATSRYSPWGPSREVTHALLWDDRMEVVTPTLKTLREIPFPPELHGKIDTLWERHPGEFEVSRWRKVPGAGANPHDIDFFRFNDRGEVTLRRTVPRWTSTASNYWFADPYLLPASSMPLSVASWLAPYAGGFVRDENSEQIRQPDEPLTWSLRWRAIRLGIRNLETVTEDGMRGRANATSFWLTLLSGLPFAALCAWRQRALPTSHFDRIAWPVLLCVFGVVGWVAFLTHRRWPRAGRAELPSH